MKILTAWAAVGMLALCMLVFPSTDTQAADHLDPVNNGVDASDIADLYAWVRTGADDNAEKTLVVIVTFAGNAAPGLPAIWDPDVLYTIHFRTSVNGEAATKDMHIRFAPPTEPDTRHGIELTNIPGVQGIVQSHVGVTRSVGDVKIYSGVNDDPFFFDLTGFGTTVQSGTLSFTGEDSFRGKNTQAIVVELPLSAVADATGKVDVWTSASRIGGPQ
ncbi:MAG: DUF4331 family protein [Myxococcota bacterium]|nr:DUF4331 family protein [Myxococcota bacterium]